MKRIRKEICSDDLKCQGVRRSIIKTILARRELAQLLPSRDERGRWKKDTREACPICNIVIGYKEDHPDCRVVGKIKKAVIEIATHLKEMKLKPRSGFNRITASFSFRKVRDVGRDFYRYFTSIHKKGRLEVLSFGVLRNILEKADLLSRFIGRREHFRRNFLCLE